MKNIKITSSGELYNFGVRKPVLNCLELLSNDMWKNYLINHWVYEYDLSEKKYVYYKHIFKNSRVIQIIYSGIDILGDGIYTLYKAKLSRNPVDNHISVYPIEFTLDVGSFECEDFLDRLLKEQLINLDEKIVFSNETKLNEFQKTLVQINYK